MKKSLIYVAFALAVSAVAASTAIASPAATRAQAAEAAHVGKKPITSGFYAGKSISYFDFGTIKLLPGNTLAPIWAITNGAAGQRNIIDTVPGKADYSPLWQLNMVTFKSGVAPYLLKSKADVDSAVQKGDVTIQKTGTVVNCPVLGFGQKRVAGFSNGKVIHYYDLGPVKVAPGNRVTPLYAPTNGVHGQHNITLKTVLPGQTDYPPLWGIITVTWKAGAHKTLLKSAAQVKKAQLAGQLMVKKTPLVVNCPVVP
jgi:hypothetical protein